MRTSRVRYIFIFEMQIALAVPFGDESLRLVAYRTEVTRLTIEEV